MMEGGGLTPVYAVNNDGNNWGNGGWIWMFLIFALCGCGGWGNNWNRGGGFDMAATFANGSMTRDQVANEFAYNDIKNGIRGLANGMCDGFYAQNATMLQGFNQNGREVLESRYQLSEAITANRFAAQQCCCETNRNIDAVRAENYRNTCEITTAIHAEGEATRALITANQMQDLRDRLEERDRQLQTANFQLSQQAQSANLIHALRPFPQPAYVTCSPYQSAANVCYGGCAC